MKRAVPHPLLNGKAESGSCIKSYLNFFYDIEYYFTVTYKRNRLVAPVVKWVGGKRQLISEISKYYPKFSGTYFEPFLGGAAVLFHFQPKVAIVNDNNAELVNLYNVIKNNPELLISDLKKHINDKEYFYEIRSLDRDKEKYGRLTPIERASRILFLNKTCYNGLFRVNSSGEFNTPFGRYKNPNIVNEITINAVSRYFNSVEISILNVDFENAVKNAKKGDFVYFDPPYDPISDSSNFTGYTKIGFDRAEQLRLKYLCDDLKKRDVKFLLSNSATDFIWELYKDYSRTKITATRAINSKAEGRGVVEEVLVKNYD